MSEQDVAQITLDFFSRLPVAVKTRDVQVSSDTGILPIRKFDHQIGIRSGSSRTPLRREWDVA